MTTTTNIRYAKQTCSRCAGSGRYSYCTMHGDRCFKCGGTGVVLSRAGVNAKAKIEAFITEHFSVPVEQLSAGDVIRDGSRNVRLVVGAHSVIGGGSWSSTGVDGKTRSGRYVRVEAKNNSAMNYCEGTTVVRSPRVGAEWDSVVAFAKTLRSGLQLVTKEN